MYLFFTHGYDVSLITFLTTIWGFDQRIVLFKFMADLVCQQVAQAIYNILKADMKAINSAKLTEEN